ncbi:contractile injection system tape measure protein [Dokdonia sp.]|uniref:contractile injection system tape measure protein n=1 Tax=Dokdonia sp. TaxID=2024995 RepID=UPI003267C672
MKNHIIHNVYLELTTSSVAEAHELKDNIGSFLSTEVFPLLEKQIDAMDHGMSEYAIQLDKVHVEITEKGLRLNDDLKYTIVETIEEETQKAIKAIGDAQKHTEPLKNGKLLRKNEHELETFIHFLKTGTNPWWSQESITKLLTPKSFERLRATRDFSRRMLRVLGDKKVRNRIINQLTREAIKELCVAMAKENDILEISDAIVQKIKKRPVIQQQHIWKEILAAIASQKPIAIETLIETAKNAIGTSKVAVTKISQEKETKSDIDTRTPTLASKQPEEIEAKRLAKEAVKEILKEEHYQQVEDSVEIVNQYTQNAGLVLIHPFLKHFFGHCDLLDENKQLKDPEKCAHLLHYIATGKTKQAESDMVFEKFLCNIPINQPINRQVIITKKHKEQAHNLLNAVNENWGALKKSSHALLRNEFLQRLGKIEKNSSGITIVMEHKTQDILLRKLSWGMGLIRLPWKKDFIYVNWG